MSENELSHASGRDTFSAVLRKKTRDEVADRQLPRTPKLQDQTDRRRWRMKSDNGVHTWHYLELDEDLEKWPQSYAEKYYLGLPLNLPNLPTTKTPLDAVKNGLEFFEKMQLPSGHWACEYGGPLFLTPCVVIVWYVTKTEIPDAWATELKNYLFNLAHPVDGGWGLHVEGKSTAFGTTINYLALRILGVNADHPVMVKARSTLHKFGGALYSAHWGKFLMAMLGVAEWDVVNPVPPELWLVPDWVPFAPWRWWCHMRQIFLPMSYIWSRKWSFEGSDLTRSLRNELFVEPYDEIDWRRHRNSIAKVDNYHPKSWLLNLINWLFVWVWAPYFRFDALVEKAEAWVSTLVDMEDANSDFLCLAPISASFSTLVCYIRDGPHSNKFQRHIERLPESLWVSPKGMLTNGTNGVQCWDTAFTIQSVVTANLHTEQRWRPMLTKALEFLEHQQIRENCKDQDKCYRQTRKGGWPFSNKYQGYAVSDCISESLKSVILLQTTDGYPKLLEDRRIFDAIDTLLLFQNGDTDGIGSYENKRAGEWIEIFNAAEVFGRIMVEYDYPECTTACVMTLSLFHKHWPDYRPSEIKLFVSRAIRWIKRNQRADGSWYGSWGICFTYAAMFALQSLESAGETFNSSDSSRRGCRFLLSKQREDGGWSESYKACEQSEYIEHASGSLVVQTSWALIGLMAAQYPDVEPLRRGVGLIMSRQQPNGEWLQEASNGVFNKSVTIDYPNYKFSFTIMALAMFSMRYPDEMVHIGTGTNETL